MWHGKEAFEHNNPRDTICTLHLILKDFTVEIYKTPPLQMYQLLK